MRSTLWCALVPALLHACAVDASADVFREECSLLPAKFHKGIKSAVGQFHAAVGKAQARVEAKPLVIFGETVDMTFAKKALHGAVNATAELLNELDELNDVNVTQLLQSARLPAGLEFGCERGTETGDVFLKLGVSGQGAVSLAADLSHLPADDLSALGLTFVDPVASLAGWGRVVGDVRVGVSASTGKVSLQVDGLTVVVTAEAAVSTGVTWKSVGSTSVSGSVAVEASIPLDIPSGLVTDVAQRLNEVRVSRGAQGKLHGRLDVAVAVTPAGQLPGMHVLIEDADLFDGQGMTLRVDADIEALEETLIEALRQVGQIDIDLSELAGLGNLKLHLPEVNVGQLVTGVSDALRLGPIAEQYFLLFANEDPAAPSRDVPTFAGLAEFVRENLPVPVDTGAVGIKAAEIVGGWFAARDEVSLRMKLHMQTELASQSFGGTVSNVLGDMQHLKDLFELLGQKAPEVSLAVPDFSADLRYMADVEIDVTVGLRTEFVNSELTGAALAGNAFVRVNYLSAGVRMEVEPINFEAELDPLQGHLRVHDGMFRLELDLQTAFGKSAEDEDDDDDGTDATPVASSEVAPVAEVTVLQLTTGGATAVLDFVRQLKLQAWVRLDVVLPVEVTAEFAGDKTLTPLVELHEERLLQVSLPSFAFSVDFDLSFLVPSLPRGGSPSSSKNFLSGLPDALDRLMGDIGGLDIGPLSIPKLGSLDGLLKNFAGKIPFGDVVDEYLDLLTKFRGLRFNLDLDLGLDLRVAQGLLDTDAFHLNILGRLQLRFPTVFEMFDNGLDSTTTGARFNLLDFLRYFQVEFGLARTLSSADPGFGRVDLLQYLSLDVDFGLTRHTARGLLRLLDLPEFSGVDLHGFPVDLQMVRFNPANYLAALEARLRGLSAELGNLLDGLQSVRTNGFNLGTLGHVLGQLSLPTFGTGRPFQLAVFERLSLRLPELKLRFPSLSWDGLPLDPTSGAEFDWRDFGADVSSMLGLDILGEASLSLRRLRGVDFDLSGLLPRWPSLGGLMQYIKARVTHGLQPGLDIGGLDFWGGLRIPDGKMELTGRVDLDLATPSDVSLVEVAATLEQALTKLFDMLGEQDTVSAIGNIGAKLEKALTGAEKHITAFEASLQLRAEVGMDVRPLVTLTGAPMVFLRVEQFGFEVRVNVSRLPADLDFGAGFDFDAVIDGELVVAGKSRATAAAPVVVMDSAQQTDFSLGPLGASLDLQGSLGLDVALSGGALPSTLYVRVEDPALFDTEVPQFAADLELPSDLVAVVQAGLGALAKVGQRVNELPALHKPLPLVNRTLHELLKTDGRGPDWGDFLIWDGPLATLLERPEYAGCAEGLTRCPLAREAVQELRRTVREQSTGFVVREAGRGAVPSNFATGGLVGEVFSVGAGVRGSLEVRVKPELGSLIDDDDIEFSGTGRVLVKVQFGFGFELKVELPEGAANVSLSDVSLRITNFTMDTQVEMAVTATAQIGLVSAAVNGGTGRLAGGFSASLNGGAMTPVSEVEWDSFGFDVHGSIAACLPFTAQIGVQDLGQLAGGQAEICVRDTDLFDAQVPEVEAKNMARLFDFRGLSPVQIMGLVRGVVNVLREYRESAVFGLPIPFTDLDLGDALDVADKLTERLMRRMVKVQPPADRPTLELCVEGDGLPIGWNKTGSLVRQWFLGNLTGKAFSLVLNDEVEVDVDISTAGFTAAARVEDLAAVLNTGLFRAGLGDSVSARAVVTADGATAALELCTNASIQATDLMVRVVRQQSGKSVYNVSGSDTGEGASPGAAGFLDFVDGMVKMHARVPAFETVEELVAVLASAIGIDEDKLKVAYAPSAANAQQYELLFRVDLPIDIPAPAGTLLLGAEVEPLLDVKASADVLVESVANIGFEFGARMGTTAGNLSLQGTPPSGTVHFMLEQELHFTLVLGRRNAYPIVLRQGEPFYAELEAQVGLVAAQLPQGQEVRVRNYKNSTFLLQSLGSTHLTVQVPEATEEVTGLRTDTAKALLFEPVVRDLYFDAGLVVSVSNVNLQATLSVLEARAYSGSGQIAIRAQGQFGNTGETLTLREVRDAVVDDPFSVLHANASLDAWVDVGVSVGVPGLAEVSGRVKAMLDPPLFVSLQRGFAVPSPNDYDVAINMRDYPALSRLKEMSMQDVLTAITTGLDLLFGPQGLLANQPLLDREIPFISVTPRVVVRELQAALEEVRALAASGLLGNLGLIEDRIESRLGLRSSNTTDCRGSCAVEFSYTNDRLTLQLQHSVVPTMPKLALDMNLGDLARKAGVNVDEKVLEKLENLADLESQLDFSAAGSARMMVEVGVDLSQSPPRLFVGGNTFVEACLQVSAAGSLTMALGPLDVSVEANVALDDKQPTPGPMCMRFGLTPMQYYDTTDIAALIGSFGLTHSGGITASMKIDGADTLELAVDSLVDFLSDPLGGLGSPGSLIKFDGLDVSNILEGLGKKFDGLNPIMVMLKDKEALVNGLDTMMGRIDDAITGSEGVLGSIQVPIIADKLREAIKDDFIEKFRGELVSKVRSRLNMLTGTDNNANGASILRDEMESQLGGTSGVLKNPIGIQVRKKDGSLMDVLTPEGIVIEGVSLEEADALEWRVTLGKDFIFTNLVDFDLGLGELPLQLKMDGSVQLAMGWELKLWFGTSLSRGFYLNVEGTDMSAYASLTLPGLTAEGKLFILKATVENRDDITRMEGQVAVDLTDTDGDGYLTFRELKQGGMKLLGAKAKFDVALGMQMSLGLTVPGLPRFVAGMYTYYGTDWSQKVQAGVAAGQVPELPLSIPGMGKLPEQPVEPGTFLLLGVGIDLGEFVTNILKPIFKTLNNFLAPLRPIIDTLQKPLPVVSDLAGRDISLLELPELLLNGLLGAGGPVRGFVRNVLPYIETLKDCIEIALLVLNVIDEVANFQGNLVLSFGNWKVGAGGAVRYDAQPVPSGWKVSKPPAAAVDESRPSSETSGTGPSGMRALFTKLTDPEGSFILPFLSARGVVQLLLGQDVDLFVVQTPKMELEVTVDFFLPVIPGVVVEFYGSFRFHARVSLGYDTSGIRKALEKDDWKYALDGFFLSDTDLPTGTGGVDIPELYAGGVVRVSGSFNFPWLLRASASGELSFEGAIDLYDPNEDGKIRVGEIKSILDKGSFLDIFSIKIKMCAGASFRVSVFNPFVNWKCKWYGCWPRGRWEKVWSWEKSVCFLDIDTSPPALPVLGHVEGSKLRVNVGPRAGKRQSGTSDSGESLTIRHVNGQAGSEEVEILMGTPPAAGQEDKRHLQEFKGFVEIDANGGLYSDLVELINPVSGGTYVGGTDDGVDRLVLDLSGRTTAIPPGVLADGRISGFGLGGSGIVYSEYEEVLIKLNRMADRVSITGSSANCKLTLQLGSGNDQVTVSAGAALRGDVFIVGGAGQDALVVQATQQGIAGKLSAGEVTGLGLQGTLTFTQMVVVQVSLTRGTENFEVLSTPPGASVEVQANGGADVISMGAGTVNDIVSPVKVLGGGAATLVINDELDRSAGSVGSLTVTRVLGLGLGAEGVLYSGFAKVLVKLPYLESTRFTVESTHAGATEVVAGSLADVLVVSGVSGPTTIVGGDGNDVLEVPPTAVGGVILNRIAAPLRLDGWKGNDTYRVGFSGTGSSRITLHDSGFALNGGEEKNVLRVDGTPGSDTFLFRTTFVALVHETVAERLDVDVTINGGITVNGHDGDDTFATDGTAGIMTQNGGAGDDRFLIGQLYFSERVADRMSMPGDAFTTTLTTEGYLSDGNREQLTCNGESGADSFVVMRNVGPLSLRGGVDNDRFTVRAFALADAEDKSKPDPKLGNTDVGTDEGNDVVFYTVNAPVNIDGGPGFDTLVAIGTDFSDTFVVTRDGIFGAGLFIRFVGIESVELTTLAGDDQVFIMSTAGHVKTSVFTGLGSDAVYVTPRYSVPVSSNDLRGHNGLIEHVVGSAGDADYNGLQAHGVTAYVADQDQASIVVGSGTPAEAPLQLLEGATMQSGERSGSYVLRLTKPVTGPKVVINVVVPSSPVQVPVAHSVRVVPEILTFTVSDWSVPRTVSVEVVDDNALEGNEVVFIGHKVTQLGAGSEADRYDNLTISPTAVRVVDSDQAELSVVKTANPTTGMRVSESGIGAIGRSVSYDVLLRPCVARGRPQDVTVAVRYDAADVTVSPAMFGFDVATGCRQTVTVTAVDDNDVEGFHFAAMDHDVVVSARNKLYADVVLESVSVEILDNDAPGLVVLESGGSTAVVEGTVDDTYALYLTRAPRSGAEVSVDVQVAMSQVWGKPSLAKREVVVSPERIVFTTANYADSVTVLVRAVVDNRVDSGETTQQFASQPALAYQIQGPLTVGGGDAPGDVGILKAVKLPGETDREAYPKQLNPFVTVCEEEQVDRLVVENSGGYLPTQVVFTPHRIQGMGMGTDRMLGGTEFVYGGIEYADMEEVVVKLGPAVDTVVVNGTHAGTTTVYGGRGDDTFRVAAAEGPVFLYGAEGAEAFRFGDENGEVVRIRDVVGVDGGAGVDTLAITNAGGNAFGSAGFLTRTELTGLGMFPVRGSTSLAVQVVSVRPASGALGQGSGTFTLSLVVDGKAHTLSFAYGTDGDAIADALQQAAFPSGKDVCGKQSLARCARSFAVERLGEWLYAVRYTGQLAGTVHSAGPVEVDTSGLVGDTATAHEYLADGTRIDAHPLLAGMAYVGMESLTVDLGQTADDVLNVRGTSVPTVVRTHGGDDTVAVGSDALLIDTAAANTVPFVEGRLAYLEAHLSIDGGVSGRNRLLVSDTLAVARRVAILTSGRLQGMAPVDIDYSGADFSRGISVWFGAGDDRIIVDGTHGPDSGENRTVTSVWAGPGDDEVLAVLRAGKDGMLVCGGEEGNDVLSASGVYVAHMLVGGTGDDVLSAGPIDKTVVLGDTGRAVFGGVDTLGVPRGSTGSLSGKVVIPSAVFTDHCADGGHDNITTNGRGAFTVLGGAGNDRILTDRGEDAVLGDFGYVEYDAQGRMTRLDTACSSVGGDDFIDTGLGNDYVGGGQGSDTVRTGDGDDVVLGDHGVIRVVYTGTEGQRLLQLVESALPASRGDDEIRVGRGDDVVLGGGGRDKVWGDDGVDVLFGDHGSVVQPAVGDVVATSLFADEVDASGGGDELYAASGADIVFGGQGDDVVDGGDGDDWLFGDHGNSTRTPSTSEVVELWALAPLQGGADTVDGGSGTNVLMGGHGGDSLTGGDSADVVFGDYGHYVAQPGRVSAASIAAEAGPLGGSDYTSTLVGAGGVDLLFGGDGADSISGGDGDDWIFGDHGKLEMVWDHAAPTPGTPCTPHVIPSASSGDVFFAAHSVADAGVAAAGRRADNVTAGRGLNHVFGGGGADTIRQSAPHTDVGTDAADVVFGDHGSVVVNASAQTREYTALFHEDGAGDAIHMQGGANIVIGGPGDDVISAHGGDDWVLGDSGRILVVPGQLTVESTASSGGSDVIAVSHGRNIVVGGAGDDNIETGDDADVVFGDHGRLQRTGSANEILESLYTDSDVDGADVIVAGHGDAKVIGGGGADTITTGNGTDTVLGDSGKMSSTGPDFVLESLVPAEGGDDSISTFDGGDRVIGGAGADNITTGAGSDVVIGDSGKYHVNATAELVTSIEAEAGQADIIVTHDGGDRVVGGAGADEITTGAGADVVLGDGGWTVQAGALLVLESSAIANGGTDIITTSDGGDHVIGGEGADKITTGAGADVVIGDNGKIERATADSLEVSAVSTAGGDADVIATLDGGDYVLGGEGSDTITTGDGADVVFGDHGSLVKTGTVAHMQGALADQTGDDVLVTAGGDDIVFGGAGSDVLNGGAGEDVLVGDEGSVQMRPDYSLVASTDGTTGAADQINGGDGDDVIIAGVFGDNVTAGLGNDVVLGDSGQVETTGGVRTVRGLFTDGASGGDDVITADEGDDLVFGQQGRDTISGGAGRDMLFGDHAVAQISGRRIVSAASQDAVGGHGAADKLEGGDADDWIFGGTGADVLHGGAGDDVLLGDYGKYDAARAVGQQFESTFTADTDGGAADSIYGEAGDDVLVGQQGGDVLHGGDGEDDITGGHNTVGGADGGDIISGGDGADVVVGDNGRIVRTAQAATSNEPFANGVIWVRHSAGSGSHFADVRRTVELFDGADLVGGDDAVDAGAGADTVYGQRGDDALSGGDGDDELVGGYGRDVLRGGVGSDVLVGDAGYVFRALGRDGKPRVNSKTGAWQRNVVLEEQARLLEGQWYATHTTRTFDVASGAALLQADLLVAFGGFSPDGTTKRTVAAGQRTTWASVLGGLSVVPCGDDELHGGDGDDVLIGQRGSDTLHGGEGDDALYGDGVSALQQQDSHVPLVVNVVRVLVDGANAGADVAVPQLGHVMHIPVRVEAEQVARAHAVESVDDSATWVLLPEDVQAMLQAVGAGDLPLAASAGVMRPFVAVVPDVVRHQHMSPGNDVLHGDGGNDLLVGDGAFHHAAVTLGEEGIESLRERAAARWSEVQHRLARLSVDAGTWQEQQGVYALPASAKAASDTLNGGAGRDTLVGDRLEVFSESLVREQLAKYGESESAVRARVIDVLRAYADVEVLGLDVGHALFEAHHAVVKELYLTRNAPNAAVAPTLELYVSNDVLSGGDDGDYTVGDSLITVAKGMHADSVPPGRDYINNRYSVPWPSSSTMRNEQQALYSDSETHARYDFSPSTYVHSRYLQRRYHTKWNKLPKTSWGSDTLQGGAGDDALVGDYGLVVTTVFSGSELVPTDRYKLYEMERAQDQHLSHVVTLLKETVTQPSVKWQQPNLRDNGVDWTYGSYMRMYHDKGYGVSTHDEPDVRPYADTLQGDDGNDVLTGCSAVSVLPVWAPTGEIVSQDLRPSSSFFSLLEPRSWSRMVAYDRRHRDFNIDSLEGGSGRDVLVKGSYDSVKDYNYGAGDRLHYLSSGYYTAADYLAAVYAKANVDTASALHQIALQSLQIPQEQDSHQLVWPQVQGLRGSVWKRQ